MARGVPRGSRRGSGRRDLVVLQSFPAPTARTTPYVTMLRDVLRSTDGVRVETFTWRRALRGDYDVFHSHWPERLVQSGAAGTRLARRVLAAALVSRLRARRVAVVTTVHDVGPPAGTSRAGRRLARSLDRLTVVRVLLNHLTPTDGVASELIPHGHYRGWFRPYPQPETVPGRIVFAGVVSPDKDVEGLVAAFQATTDRSLRLRVAGAPTSHALSEQLHQTAAPDPRVSLALRHLPDAEFVAEIRQAELVVVPHRRTHNSGAVLAALSLDRPVLVPDNAVNRELAAEVGPGWVWTYSGDLEAEDLTRNLDVLRSSPRSPSPALAGREWTAAGWAHLTAYRQAVTGR